MALVATAILAGFAIWLEMGTAGRYGALADAAGESGTDPVAAVAAAGRAHRFVFLADVPGSDAPDRLAGAVVEALARSVGLGALVVSVSEAEQGAIDRYLASDPEDTSPLIARPAAAGGPGTPLLPLYRRVRALNRELGAARSVRIIASEPADWPPRQAVAPAQAVQRWAQRDEHMVSVVETKVLARDSRARALFLVDGLHALRAPFTLRTGGTGAVQVEPLAMRMAERWPREVWSALIDVPAVPATAPLVAALTGSDARESLRRAGIAHPFAVPVTPGFGTAAEWLHVATQPGVSFAFATAGIGLSDVVDAYVHTVR